MDEQKMSIEYPSSCKYFSRAKPAVEFRVNHLARSLPPKILIVFCIIRIETQQVVSKVLRRSEVLYMDERLVGSHKLVVVLEGPITTGSTSFLHDHIL